MLSFCVTLRGRRALFTNCMRALETLLTPARAEVVVAHWPCAELPDLKWLHTGVRRVAMSGPFSRGRGLNWAATAAANDTLFFIDADMILGTSVVQQALQVCGDGGAYFPICRSFSDKDHKSSYWREAGYGIVAVTKPVLKAVGGWDELETWGGEDRKFYERVSRHTLVVRTRSHELWHQWHEPNSPTGAQYVKANRSTHAVDR